MGIRKWITPKELLLYFRIPLLMLGLSGYWNLGFKTLYTDIISLWRSNGSTWLVQYLTEVTRILVCWAGNEKYTHDIKSVRVARTGLGLPKIIPHSLRTPIILFKKKGSEEGKLVFRAVLTVLSVYRVIGCFPKRKLGTIIDPFKGSCKTLPEWEIARVLALLKTRVRVTLDPDLMKVSESSGPNYAKATYGSPLDAIAFLVHPLVWVYWLRYCFSMGYFRVVLWQISLVLIALPFLPAMLIIGCFPKFLGRLVPLNEARGKVRIIAICDWWTQVAFFPIHKAIMTSLRSIPQDGTYNQSAPLDMLISRSRLTGHVLRSFDLSAATDRLPIDLQVQILNLCGIRGDLWKGVLNRPWWLDGEKVYYAVGQPMGCYSSWAMLALSHHTIVQIAALRSGYKGWFPDYALLGDDIVIANDSVADAYLTIMEALGVDINKTKSHQGDVAEFAKRWIHRDLGELSPIGSGDILLTIRNYRNMPSLLVELRNKSFPFPFSHVRNSLTTLPFLRRKVSGSVMLALELMALGPSGLSANSSHVSGQALERWLRLLTPWQMKDIAEIAYTLFRKEYTRQSSIALAKYRADVVFFDLNWSRYTICAPGNSYSCYGIGAESGNAFSVLKEILLWKDATYLVRLETFVSYLISMVLVRVSPAYHAYHSRPDPHDDLWLRAQDLPWIYSANFEMLANMLREMISDDGSSDASIASWSEPRNTFDFIEIQDRLLKTIDREVATWYGTGPKALVPIHVEPPQLAEDDPRAYLLDEGYEIVE